VSCAALKKTYFRPSATGGRGAELAPKRLKSGPQVFHDLRRSPEEQQTGSPLPLRQTYRPTHTVGKSKRFTTRTGYEICGLVRKNHVKAESTHSFRKSCSVISPLRGS
jgi:hypothetical protein